MSLAVIEGEKISFFNYGSYDKNSSRKITEDTIFEVASFTKTFTASLAAQAFVDGKLNLDKPFIEYFPEVSKNKELQNISSKDILFHTASLPFNLKPYPKTYLEFIQILNKLSLSSKPVSEYVYSNLGIGIMGYVVQNAYGKDYFSVLKEKILDPLKMHSTYLNLPKENDLVIGQDKTGNIVPYDPDIGVLFSSASLKSTSADMAKYLLAQINVESVQNKKLSKAFTVVHNSKVCFADGVTFQQLAWQAHNLSEMNKPQSDVFGAHKIVSCSKNFILDKDIFIDKTGSGYGNSSYMAYLPKEQKGIVILLNKVVGDKRIEFGRKILTLN